MKRRRSPRRPTLSRSKEREPWLTVILITAPGGKTVAKTFKGLRPGGVSIAVGVGPEPIEVTGMDLIFATRKVEGALTGTPAIDDTALRFSALSGVSAMIETVPLEQELLHTPR